VQRRSCFPEGRGSGLGVHRWAVEQSIALLRKPISVTVRLLWSWVSAVRVPSLTPSCIADDLDALAGAVPLNVDLDVVLSVLASTLCAALRRRLPGYGTATPDTLQRRFLSTGGIILNRRTEIVVRLNRRTYSPVLRQSSLPETITVPWWGNRTLRYEYA